MLVSKELLCFTAFGREFYDEENLETLWQETHSWPYDEILNLYSKVPKYGLQSEFMKKKVYIEAQRLLEIAISGFK